MRAGAVALVDHIVTRFVHPDGGYRDSIPDAQLRLQNPHMHLFEALLAASDAFGGERFFNCARELAALSVDCFFQVK